MAAARGSCGSDLPEMLLLLGSFLLTKDILQGILVCKYWNSVLATKIWHTVRVGAKHQDRAHFHRLDQLDKLEHHIQLVRSLNIAMKDSSTILAAKDPEAKKAEERLKDIVVQCRGLIQLNTNSFYEGLLKVLVNCRETLVSFDLSSAVNDQRMLSRLWHVLSDDTLRMRNLRHLTLKCVKIHGNGSDPTLHLAFVKICQRLETLECTRCRMEDWTPPLLPIHEEGKNEDTQRMRCTLKKVKLLEVMDKMSTDILFLKQSTSLEELTWSSCFEQPLDQEFRQFLAESHLKSLKVAGLQLPG
ncbi:hypothetical protein B0O80DRAFT_427850 [Mortierella sp. GBAus27b]|nr:hypothetical protein B0O80DRAFT_427850 [Mortierella sp. GBAus27b]